jgi:hypothetical protein
MVQRQLKIRHDIGMYALRRTLPSWCFDRALKELLALCSHASLDEVIVIVDTEEFSHGIPTLEWLDAYMPRLQAARDALHEQRVAFSINPWVTLGHIDRGRDLRDIFKAFDWMVGHDGIVSRACACPLSKAWQEHTQQLWRKFASLQPRVIWVEDDLRSFNHLPVRYGCFCERHLAEFSRLVKAKVSREDVVAKVLAQGTPHPWRAIWLKMQADSLLEAASVLERAVHDVSPRTQLGMMSSGPELHCVEGRDWTAHAKAMGGGQSIYSRPTLGNYTESSLKDLTYAARQIKLTRHVLPAETIEQSEVENIPFGGYAKSAKLTFLQIALSLAHGCQGVTLNLYDHLGSPVEHQPSIANMLAEGRPFFDALRKLHPTGGSFQGVGLLYHPQASVTRHLSAGARWEDLVPCDHQWSEVLSLYGVSTTYDASPATAIDGQVLRAYTDEQVRDLLSRGVLLDLTAAEVVIERGFGAAIGAASIERQVFGEKLCVAAEEFHNRDFAGGDDRYATMTLPHLGGGASFGIPSLLPAAIPVSRLVGPDRQALADFSWIFSNASRGRVAVVPIDLRSAFGPALLNVYRRDNLLALLRWLADGELPAVASGGANGLTYRLDYPDRIMLGLFNLDHDPWNGVTWETELPEERVSEVEWLDERGRLQRFGPSVVQGNSGRLRLHLRTQVNFDRPLILVIRLRRDRGRK